MDYLEYEATTSSTMCIIDDNVAEELKLVGTSTLQVQDWGPGPTTGPADTLSDIWNDINEIEAEQYPSELLVNPNVKEQCTVETQNSQDVLKLTQRPMKLTPVLEDQHWVEKTTVGRKNVAEVFQIKRSDREETIKLSIHPQDYQGLVLIGLAHDSPEMHTTPIMNKGAVVEQNCEKMAAFSCWNENDSIPKRVIYGKMTCNKLYGTVICAMVERQPGEDICIRFNTEGRNEKNAGNKAVNRIWRLLTAPVDMLDGWYEELFNNLNIQYDLMDHGIGYVKIQVVAEIRGKNKPSKRAFEIAFLVDLYDKASDLEDKKKRYNEILLKINGSHHFLE